MKRRDFGVLEPGLTIVLVLVFFFGLIFFAWRGVSNVRGGSNPANGSEVSIVMGRIERLVSGAVKLNAAVSNGAQLGNGCDHTRLDFLEDLDGDPNTGSFSIDGKTGLERVLLERPSARSRKLLVKVFENEGDPFRVVTLAADLPADREAFDIQYLAATEPVVVIPGTSGPAAVPSQTMLDGVTGIRVHLSLRTRVDNRSRTATLTRVIPLRRLTGSH